MVTNHLYGLRGICAICVMLYHYKIISTSFLTDNVLITNGYKLVDFFFLISGLILFIKYRDKAYNFKFVSTFLKKRFLRLYPLHFLVLILFFIIEILKYVVEINFNLIANTPAFFYFSIENLLKKIFLIEGFLGIDATLFLNPVSWSISVEFFLYIFLIFSLYFFKKNSLIIFSFFTLISLFFLIKSDDFYNIGEFNCLMRGFYSFFSSILIFFIFDKYKFKFKSIFLCNIIILINIYLIFLAITQENLYLKILFPIFVGSILSITVKNENNFLNSILNLDLFTFLGKISYGIYMIHVLVWWSINQIMRFLLKYETVLDNKSLQKINIDPQTSAIVLIIGVLITVVFSYLSHQYFEKRYYR